MVLLEGQEAALPALRTTPSSKALRRQVGFQPTQDSPSSVLRAAGDGGDASPASAGRHDLQQAPVESPLAAALRRERSTPQLPQLPKLRLGLKAAKGAGMQRSKSHGNLRQASAATEVPPAPKSATNSPHAASSGGSEPVRIPFERGHHRRIHSVDFELPAASAGGSGPAPPAAHEQEDGAEADLSTSVISAASSMLGHHLGAGASGRDTAGGGSTATGTDSARGSPSGVGTSGVHTRMHSAARDLYLANADAVMALAQVQSLRREQDEVLRLREQLQLMTAERDRLLAELQLGSIEGGAPVFDMDSSGGLERRGAQQRGQPPPRPRSALRTTLRLP